MLGKLDVHAHYLPEPYRQALERAGRALPAARRTRELDDLLADASLDAVVLATPVPTHAALAVRVVEVGPGGSALRPVRLTVEAVGLRAGPRGTIDLAMQRRCC